MIFISNCMRQSRIFIARILVLLRKVHFSHHHVNLTVEFRKDIVWWRRFLRAYQWFLPPSGLLRVKCLLPMHVWRAAAGSVATNILMLFFHHSLCNTLLTLIALNFWQSLLPCNYGVQGGLAYVYQWVVITTWPWLYSILDAVGTLSWTRVCANFVILRVFTNLRSMLFTFPVS